MSEEGEESQVCGCEGKGVERRCVKARARSRVESLCGLDRRVVSLKDLKVDRSEGGPSDLMDLKREGEEAGSREA